jgi:ribosomal protein S18 acetylase RimI-like enzyme
VFVRQASLEDAELVLDIFNSEIAAVDPEHGLFGLDIAKHIIESPATNSPTWLFSDDEESIPFGLANLNPDLTAKEMEAALAVRAGDARYPVLLDWCLAEAQRDYPDFRFQLEINQKHSENMQHLQDKNFKNVRDYNSLRAPIAEGLLEPELPERVVIRTVDLENKKDLTDWHYVQQTSFAENFGFTPRDFETWLKRVKEDQFIPSDGVFLLYVQGKPSGFIWTDDMDAFALRGFISYVGVLKEHRGKGFGQALIAAALARFSRKGYDKAELGVDTQNSSNALRVYEKMGFTKVSTWVLHERPVVIN